jgi:hypothetical protein
MNEATDPITLALTGALPFAVIAAALVAFPAALFLLSRYRRAVLRGMSESAGAAMTADRLAGQPTPPSQALRFESLGLSTTRAASSMSSAWRAARLHALAVAAYAIVMAIAQLLSIGETGFAPVRFATMFWVYFWPAVLSTNLIAAADRGTALRVAAVYFAIFFLLTGLAVALSPELTVTQVLAFWFVTNGPATVLLYAMLARPVRAVGPMVLGVATLGMIGAVAIQTFMGASDANMRAAIEVGDEFGLGAIGVFWGTALLGFVLFGIGAWIALRWLGRAYAAKLLSDEMLTLDAMMLPFAVDQPMLLVFEHWAWYASGLAAFIVYRLVAAAMRRRLPATDRPRTLLLLRVFALGARSESLFDALRKLWLRGGSIAMIAGPDLVKSAVEPDEFLGFLSGQLGRRFVSDEADLEQRIEGMDRRPDPDGRFRVAEFFCRDDTWQATMRRLVGESDAVLMDLRSFAPSNQGCVYELGRLLDSIDLRSVVFVVDRTTDRAFLEQELSRLWSTVAADSPNRLAPTAAARIFEVSGPTAVEARALIEQLTAG